MATAKLPEVWLRGPLPDIPPLLQPVAHALLQAREELAAIMEGFPDSLLWKTPAGVASPGFHLQHLSGVLDRLFTYAKGAALSAEQLHYLHSEGKPFEERSGTKELVQSFSAQVDKAIEQLTETKAETLQEFRGVGRAQLPSTVMGLLFHAAEHTMRHVGQLMVTVKLLQAFQNEDIK